jgi:hypothetical protein
MAGFIIPALMGLPSLISGILDAVHSSKKISGGKLMMARRLVNHPKFGSQIRNALRMYHMANPRGGRMRHRYIRRRGGRRGKGIAANIAGAIPLIGPLLGPLVSAFGGRLRRKRYRRRGRGLVPMDIYQPIAYGGGLLGPGAYRPPTYGGPLSVVPYGHTLTKPFGKGYNYGRRGGLLSPTGYGGAIYRKGYYKYQNGKRVHVRPTLVRGGKLRRRRY